jgi:single-strand DNA-binding protein
LQKNRIEPAGYLAAKPELRYLPSGTNVANARLGESYKHRGQDGQVQTHTNWHSLTSYDQLAGVAVTYEQGENVFIEGAIQQRKFTPKDGVTRTVHEVIVRSCHVIEPPRVDSARPESAAGFDPISSAGVESHQGDLDDATWPV